MSDTQPGMPGNKRWRLPGGAAPWALVGLALVVRLLTAALLRQPGYTDAYYYAAGARQMALGQGLVEPFIWNYLDPPAAVTHPGYLYWMPLAAMLGWLGTLVGDGSFRAIQAPFVLLSALLPLVAYGITLDLGSPARKRYAVLAGLLAVVPGFYTHVLVLPDNFTPFALAGSLCLWAAGRGMRDGRAGWFGLAGLMAGLGHLARADGLLLMMVAAGCTLIVPASQPVPHRRLAGLGGCLLGYLLVMTPWLARNWLVAGSPLPGGGLRTLFLTTYDDMFAYGRSPTLDSFLAWGWDEIARSKLLALGQNALRLWVENLVIVLLPFAAAGLWRLRRDPLLWPFLVYLPLLFLAMTLAFTLPGTRGGLYHSGSALLPFFFAATGPGLMVLLGAIARRSSTWHAQRAWPVFAGSLVTMALLVTLFSLWRNGGLDGGWNRRDAHYVAVGEWLKSQEVDDPVVMVGDAPALAWHTGLRAVAVPNEPLDTIAAVAARYGATYLLLDDTRPRTTDVLYRGEEDDPRFNLVYQGSQAQLYALTGTSPGNQQETSNQERSP